MSKTAIEWTDTTWNPVVGCTKVSPGCAHCYAETMAARLKAMALADIAAGKDPGRKRHYIEAIDDKGRWSGKLIPVPEALGDPLRWKKPRMVFVNSMSDLFHEDVPFDFIDQVFDVMWQAKQHTFQVLTKRVDRMVEYIKDRAWAKSFGWTEIDSDPFKKGDILHLEDMYYRNQCGWRSEEGDWMCGHPTKPEESDCCTCNAYECPIAWEASDRKTLEEIGVAEDYTFDEEGYAENSEWMELHTRPRWGAVSNAWLGFSAENQKEYEDRVRVFRQLRGILGPYFTLFMSGEPLLGPIDFRIRSHSESKRPDWSPLDPVIFGHAGYDYPVPTLNWIITGGESGGGARHFEPDWFRSIRDQCHAAGVAFFMKQMDKKEVIPQDLFIRQYPSTELKQLQRTGG